MKRLADAGLGDLLRPGPVAISALCRETTERAIAEAPEHARPILEARKEEWMTWGMALVPEFRGAAPETFSCPECLDRAYLVGTRRNESGNPIGTMASACLCDAVTAADAGYWFDVVFPLERGYRKRSEAGARRLKAYLATMQGRRPEALNDRIERLRHDYENARKRKLEEQQFARGD